MQKLIATQNFYAIHVLGRALNKGIRCIDASKEHLCRISHTGHNSTWSVLVTADIFTCTPV